MERRFAKYLSNTSSVPTSVPGIGRRGKQKTCCPQAVLGVREAAPEKSTVMLPARRKKQGRSQTREFQKWEGAR